MSHFVASAKIHANNTRMFMLTGNRARALSAKKRAGNAADKAAHHALNTKTVEAARHAANARAHAVRARKYVNGKFGRFKLN